MMKIIQPNTVLNGYQIIESIGLGVSGVVYKVRNIQNGIIYALKHCATFQPEEMDMLSYLQQIKLKHIVNVIQYWVQKIGYTEELYIIMEYCPGGNLLQQNSTKQPQEIIDKYVKELLQAVQQMHTAYLIHRDIKPENIVFDHEGTLKLCDFGLSKYNQGGFGMTKQIGTPYYMAPELITATMANQNYSNSIDCWAVGCLIYELYRLEPLFYGNTIQEVQTKIVNFQKLQKWKIQLTETITNKKHLTIAQGFIQPANDRISAQEALNILNSDEKKQIKIVQVNNKLEQQDPPPFQFNLQQSQLQIKKIIQASKTDPKALKIYLQSLIKADRDPNHPNSQLVKRCVDACCVAIPIAAKIEKITDTTIQFLKEELKYV